MRLDDGITRPELALVGLEQLEVLLESEQVFGAILPRQGGRDVRFRRMAPAVAMLGQLVGIGAPATIARTIRSPVTPVISLTTRASWRFICTSAFCIPLHMGSGALHERVPMPQIGAQCHDPRGGAKAPAQQADTVQLAQPFAVDHVALAARHMLHMVRVDQEHLDTAGLEQLIERDPVDACGFHRHARDTAGGQPRREALEIGRERPEGSDRARVAIGRHRHEVFRGPAVDAGGVRIEALQHRRGHPPLQSTTTAIILHWRLLPLTARPGTGSSGRESILLNGITLCSVSPVTRSQLPGPRLETG